MLTLKNYVGRKIYFKLKKKKICTVLQTSDQSEVGKCILKMITRLFVLKIVKRKKILCQAENFVCIFSIRFKIQFIQSINEFLYFKVLTDPGRREKINLNFYFHTSLWCLRRFYEGLKGLQFLFYYNFLKCTGQEGLKTKKKNEL